MVGLYEDPWFMTDPCRRFTDNCRSCALDERDVSDFILRLGNKVPDYLAFLRVISIGCPIISVVSLI